MGDCKEELGDSKDALGEALGEALGDGKEVQEKRVYDEVHKYLTKNAYSTSATKVETATVRRKAKNVQVLDGILYYTGPKGDAKKAAKQRI